MSRSGSQHEYIEYLHRYSDFEGSEQDFEFPVDFDQVEAHRKLLSAKDCARIVLRYGLSHL